MQSEAGPTLAEQQAAASAQLAAAQAEVMRLTATLAESQAILAFSEATQDEPPLTAESTTKADPLEAVVHVEPPPTVQERSHKMSSTTCSFCAATPAKLLRCSGCKAVWYCNAECQKQHWKTTHRAECKTIQQAKIRENTMAAAAELHTADAMRTVVQSQNIMITRCADPDDSVYMQVMAQPAIHEFIQQNQMECWCQSVGTFAPSESMFAVATFTRAQVEALPQPKTELELSDHSRERGVLESEPIRAFGGLRLCITAAPAMGQLAFGLRELAYDPAPPLDAVKGVALIASIFLLTGDDAGSLLLPPPMSHGHFSGVQRENASMKVWCGIGESESSIVCSSLEALPTVSRAALREACLLAHHPLHHPPRTAAAGSNDDEAADDVIAVGVLLERCGATSTVDDFEALSIQAFLHGPHTRQQPEAAVPEFCRSIAAAPHAVAALRARSDSEARLSWMAKGKGM